MSTSDVIVSGLGMPPLMSIVKRALLKSLYGISVSFWSTMLESTTYIVRFLETDVSVMMLATLDIYYFVGR